VWTAQANLGRHFTHMHYAQFSKDATHIKGWKGVDGINAMDQWSTKY
jgi:hypothetical protein